MAEVKALVVAEHDNAGVRPATLNTVTAAGQLGDDKPPTVWLAGVYAMAGLMLMASR